MKRTVDNQVLALAAVVDAAVLVDQLATRGRCDSARERVLIESLFTLDAASFDEIYGGAGPLRDGLEHLMEQFATSSLPNLEVARYQMAMLQLQRRMQANGAVRQRLREGLEQIVEFRRLSQPGEEQLSHRIAALYQETISALSPRIMVKGRPEFLQIDGTSSRVRALLLAGIRAGVLWQQAGGSRWSLLFGRRAYLDSARRTLESLD